MEMGGLAHSSIDSKTASTRKIDLVSLTVYSDSLRIYGKIDIFKSDKHQLIERKNNLKKIFRGQLYQLWGQYYCMTEMDILSMSCIFMRFRLIR